MTPEQQARCTTDQLLAQAGWAVQDMRRLNLGAARGVAIREFSTLAGSADYLLVVDRKAVGVVEAKKVGEPRYAIRTSAWFRALQRGRVPQ